MIAAFGIGARFVWTRRGAVTAALATAAGFLIALLLGLVLAIPSGVGGPERREDRRIPVENAEEAITPIEDPSGMLVASRNTLWRGEPISVVQVSDTGATPPPGVAQLPGPGKSVVSPKLEELLKRAPDLRQRVPKPVALIETDVLATPDELFAYVGVTEDAVERQPHAIRVHGWGWNGDASGRDEIPAILSVPLAALVLAPTGTLLVTVLRLDLRQRQQRLGALNLLGASRRQLAAADLGVVLPPLLVGWLLAVFSRPWLMESTADTVLVGRVMSGGDLRPGIGGELLALGFLVILALVVSLAENQGVRHPQRQVPSAVAELAKPLGLGGLLLCVGLLGAWMSIQDPQSSQALFVLGSAVLIVVGASFLVGPFVITVGRMLARSSLAGELALIRIRTPRSGWRPVTTGLLLAGTVVGVALPVLQRIDAATATDEVRWRPAQVSATAAFAYLTVPELEMATASGRFRDIVPLVPTGQVHLVGETGGDLKVVLVSCQDAQRIVAVQAESCDWVASFDQVVEAGLAVRIEDIAGRPLKETTIVPGRSLVPPQLMYGSSTLLVTVTESEIQRALKSDDVRRAISDSYRPAIGVLLEGAGRRDVEWLRNQTWEGGHEALYGESGSLSNVVSKSDLLADGRYYRDTYTSLLLGAIGAGLLGALLTSAAGAAAHAREQYVRNAVLDALGASGRLIRSAHSLSDLLPVVISASLTLLVGAGLGVLYLGFASAQAPDRGSGDFPFGVYTMYTLAALAAFCVVTLAVQSATRLALGRQSAVVLREMRGG